MAERSADDILAGVLRLTIEGVEKVVPTLKTGAARLWARQVTAEVPWLQSVIDDDGSVEQVGDFVEATFDKLVDLIVAYDKTGALGGREWLEAHADPSDLYDAARQMGAVSFPFVSDLRTLRILLAGVLAQQAEASDQRNSTNGVSTPGDSTPQPSKSGSTGTS